MEASGCVLEACLGIMEVSANTCGSKCRYKFTIMSTVSKQFHIDDVTKGYVSKRGVSGASGGVLESSGGRGVLEASR